MRMRHFLIAAAGLVTLANAAEPAPVLTADALGWLSGDWAEIKGERWTEEHWSQPRAGMLLGAGRSGRGERLGSFEFMRIAPGEHGVLHFFGAPQGAPAVGFRLVRSGPAEAVFENPTHDFPQRVRYWRDGELLKAEVSDLGGAKKMAWTYTRR